MLWDTMDYHVYAGFSALHDRFAQDYFAAGPQGYFNPYAYVPFYLLLRTPLTALEDASILAVVQSAILWVTFEMALLTFPRDQPRASLAAAMLAVALAFANPVLINQLGSSYADITTAEIALAGWLALVGAVQTPSARRVLYAALLLGAASALKLTNAVHAVSAAALLLFIPGGWRSKARHATLFAAGVAAAFVVVSAPWSVRLEQHFGNPLFPVLNGVFRSPQLTTASLVDYRFIPVSLGAALLRPFTMVASIPFLHFELRAPDLRYALVLVLALLLLLQQAWRRFRKRQGTTPTSPEQAAARRVLAALGCGFLLDWVLWLTASGNSRYFMPMACVAAVLGVCLVFRLWAARPRLCCGLLVAVLGVQCAAIYAGADYRARLPWTEGPWVDLSMPPALASQASLYFTLGMQSNSFIIPYLATGSGFINLDGAYVLGPGGANGERIEALIERYAPHLRVIVRDPQPVTGRETSLPTPERVADTLEPFGLKAVANGCLPIVAHAVTNPPAATTEYLVTCEVDRSGPMGVPLPGQRAADVALDHLEDACPALLQPRRPVDVVRGDPAHGYVFARRYWSTASLAWTYHGSVKIGKYFEGWSEIVGPERAWQEAPPRISCAREGPVLFPTAKGAVGSGATLSPAS
jgi:Glycosyltransferase family 87